MLYYFYFKALTAEKNLLKANPSLSVIHQYSTWRLTRLNDMLYVVLSNLQFITIKCRIYSLWNWFELYFYELEYLWIKLCTLLSQNERNFRFTFSFWNPMLNSSHCLDPKLSLHSQLRAKHTALPSWQLTTLAYPNKGSASKRLLSAPIALKFNTRPST